MLKIVLAILYLTLAATAFAGPRYALVVGANDGGEARPKLRYAGQDAGNISDILKTLGKFPKGSVQTLMQPDKATLLRHLESLSQTLGKDAEFVFYYSGHADDYGLLLGQERFLYRQLRDLVKSFRAKVKLLIIDACSSGSLSSEKGGSSQPSFLVPLEQDASGFAVMTSSSMNESSQESERLRSSFFTHYLLTGMRGAADNNKDLVVTLNEAFQYANQQTREATSKTRMGVQHPTYEFELKGRGDFVLADLREKVSSISFPKDSGQIFYIRSTSGKVFVELQKKFGAVETLALEAGSYEIVQYAEQQYYQGTFDLKPQETIDFKKVSLTAIPSEKVMARGDLEFPQFYEKNFISVSLLPDKSQWDGSRKTNRTALINVSPFIASIERVEGVGFGLVGHMSSESRGVTVGLAFNYSQVKTSGVQFSLGMNSSSEMRGIQFAPVNSAYQVNGGQVGIVNSGSLVSGTQVGLVNIAQAVDGNQFGIVNYAERSEGFSFAPITIVKNGILRAEVWTDGSAIPEIGLRSGSPYFYSTAFIGIWRYPMLGVGPGVRLPYEDSALSLDISWAFYQQRTAVTTYTSFYDGTEQESGGEEQIRNLQRMRFFYEWSLGENWNGMVGVSRFRQSYHVSDRRRIKTFNPLLIRPSVSDDASKTDTSLMFGLSYSLLKGRL